VKGTTIEWGLISPFSGAAGSYGPPERAADEVAIDLINSEGGVKVGGKSYKFALKTYDSAYEPTKAVTVTRQAVDEEHLRYLEVLGGGVVPAVQPIIEPAKGLVFAVADGNEFIGPKHPLTFRPYYDITKSVEADLKYLGKEVPQGSSVASLYPDDDLGHSVGPATEKAIQSLGYKSNLQYVPREATDFSGVLNKVVGSARVIEFGPTPPSQYAVMVKQARQLGYKGKFAFPDTLALSTLLESVKAGEVAGSVASPQWEGLKTKRGEQFTAGVKAKKAPLEGWTAQAFDNLFLVKAAMEKANSLDTAAVEKALPEVSIEGALGHLQYSGAQQYGLPRVLEATYPVAVITPSGGLKAVTEVDITH
jgi:branched-chain amino acid transport system substrate-binding protein